MHKRYLRIDIEYDFDLSSPLYMLSRTIEKLLAKDIPYCTIIFSRDSSKRNALNEPVYTGTK